MVIIILVCVGFGTSVHLTNAYGMTVASVMIVTTILLSLVMYLVWGFIFLLPLAFLLFFGTIDGVFWACIFPSYFLNFNLTFALATLKKFILGAWFPFMVSIVMSIFMAFWRWGMSKKRNYEWDRRVRLSEFLRREGELPALQGGEGAFILGTNKPSALVTSEPIKDPTSPKSSTSKDSMAIAPVNKTSSASSDSLRIRKRTSQQLFLRATDTPVVRLPGISIFYTTASTSHSHAPHTFRHFLEHFPALHSTCIFLHVRTAAQPHVPFHERLVLERSPLWDGVWRGVYRIGYMETPDFAAAEFTINLFDKLGRQVDGLTHVLQYTQLKARRDREARGDSLIKKIPEKVRGYAIDVIWSGIDEVLGGVAKGWKVPVGEIVSVGAVAEV